ncbi:Enoyl-CoA delta isomerase 3 [Hondaea fermentalgiana]|uniref:Enoyl-CoA delta isomerase 3 n=1 Tax=Hondaea fermentalgiana TaxID=2315210 RepID=A0A2R5GHG3_9STRA|nr:Enoyl-CoA delta isomerase 3 [Hondaea fermentalgiana]|eukprot:GBG30322.1 Enoyl-CoA delta isomerase 3 [Hondaea fermentalgiana]
MGDTVNLRREGNVFVLEMRSAPSGEGDKQFFENRFNPTFMKDLNAALDQIEAQYDRSTPGALVTTSKGKLFSNGLDLDWLNKNAATPKDRLDYLEQVQLVLCRFLTFPLPTIAAVNGHAFGGGMLLAMAHDYRIMNSDRGFFCMPEVDMPMKARLTPGFNALIKEKVSRKLVAKIILEGFRFDVPALLEDGLIDEAASGADLMKVALTFAEKKAPKGKSMTLGELKQDLYLDAVAALRGPATFSKL